MTDAPSDGERLDRIAAELREMTELVDRLVTEIVGLSPRPALRLVTSTERCEEGHPR